MPFKPKILSSEEAQIRQQLQDNAKKTAEKEEYCKNTLQYFFKIPAPSLSESDKVLNDYLVQEMEQKKDITNLCESASKLFRMK